jgi:hypothetical protein
MVHEYSSPDMLGYRSLYTRIGQLGECDTIIKKIWMNELISTFFNCSYVSRWLLLLRPICIVPSHVTRLGLGLVDHTTSGRTG